MPSPAQPALAADVALRLAGASDADADRAITDTLAAIGAWVGADRAYVCTYGSNGRLSLPYEWTARGVVPHAPAIAGSAITRFPHSWRLAREGRVMLVQGLEDFPEEAVAERESFGFFGIQTVVQVPITIDHVVLGVLGCNHSHSYPGWTSERIAELELIARAIGATLSRTSANERTRRAIAVAERANRVKDELISRASHELRTPLHAVLGFAEILEMDGVTHDALIHIRENGTLLLSMIDDLLDLGQLDPTGGLTDDRTRPAETVLDDVLDLIRPVAASRGITLDVVRHGDPTPLANPSLLRQVAHCLTSAALVGAGPGGSIIGELVEDADAGTVRLSLRYRGPRHRPPVGLGLALARSFAEDAGGTMDVIAHDDSTTLEVTIANTPPSNDGTAASGDGPPPLPA